MKTPGDSTTMDTSVLERRERFQRRQQVLRIVFDGPHARAAEDRGKGAPHHVAIGQHVGDAGRNAQIVLEHDEDAVFAPHQIGAAHIDIGAVRHGEPAHLAPVMLRAVDHAARNEPVLQHAPVAVDVVQKQIERRDALLQSRFEARPFRRGDDARQTDRWE